MQAKESGNKCSVVRKPAYTYANNKDASAQSDQRLCCSLFRYYTSRFYSQIFKPLANLYSRAGLFESNLVGNPEDRLSHDGAQMSFSTPV